MGKELNTIGKRIAKARKDAGYTQVSLAEQLNVSFQAVSLWERDLTVPDTYNLIDLAKVLKVSVSSLVEDRNDYNFTVKENIFDYKHMTSFIRHTARANNMENTLKALNFALKAHEGQTRKRSDIPYIYHPLNLACHLFAMNIKDDEVIAASLLHDVLEDCKYDKDELPVNDRVKELVELLTHLKEDSFEKYIKSLRKDSSAALIKCLDRCNNLTTMSWGFGRDKIYEYIKETELYILPLLDVVKADLKYNNAAWLLKYQIESMLDIYKRLM